MISFHPVKDMVGAAYANGFKVADTNSVMRLSRAIEGWVWSPCIWRDGVRRQDHFLRADWCVLDFDDGEMSLREACDTFCDMVHIIGTTKSHQKEKGGPPCDRFRVLLKWERPVTDLRDYRFNMKKILSRYPADPAPKDGARFFFPCTMVVQASSEGYTEGLLPTPENFERPNLERLKAYGQAGILPPRVRDRLVNVVPEGARNTTWYCLAKDMVRCGLDEIGIVDMIVSSKTYEGRVGPSLLHEIAQCVRNGAKAVARETVALSGEAHG